MSKNKLIYPMSAQYLTDCMFNITDDCNLQCQYCFVEQQPHYMNLDTAKKAVDWLYINFQKKNNMGLLNKDDRIRIYFFGGEPMLCYQTIIKPVIEYCETKYSLQIFQFGMTTNGTLFNQENIDFIKKYNFQLLLSFDGTKETQNFNRPCKQKNNNSFNLIINNIDYLLLNFPDLCARSTIYAPTVQNLFNDYLYIESLGFKHWDAVVDSRHDWNQENIRILKEQFSQIYAYRLQQILKKQPVMESNRFDEWISIIIKLYSDPTYFDVSNNLDIFRCGLGTTTGAISWDGSIYGCQEQVSHGHSSLFYIGSIFSNGIDIQKHYKLLSTYYDFQLESIYKTNKCKNCELNPVCQINYHGCPSTLYDLFSNMNALTEVECEMRKIYFNNSLLTLKLLFSLEDQDILKYLLNTIYQEKIGGEF